MVIGVCGVICYMVRTVYINIVYIDYVGVSRVMFGLVYGCWQGDNVLVAG